MVWWLELLMIVLSWYAIQDIFFEYSKKKDFFRSKHTKIVVGWLLFLSIMVPYFIYDSSRTIDDNKLYYVNMFPDENSQKNYRVPASISKEEDGIYLSSVDWDNGGSTFFYGDVRLILDNKVFIEDEEGEDWYIEFTGKVAGE